MKEAEDDSLLKERDENKILDVNGPSMITKLCGESSSVARDIAKNLKERTHEEC